jgi:hypothetical protein
MDASIVEYYKILLDITVAAIVSVVLLQVARRSKREKTLVGFRARSKSEKYAGYVLLPAGIIVMALSLLELIILLNSNYYSDVPFGLSGIQISSGSQTTELVSAQFLGLGFSISFWLLIFVGGGGKMVALSMDLLAGTRLKIIKKLRS